MTNATFGEVELYGEEVGADYANGYLKGGEKEKARALAQYERFSPSGGLLERSFVAAFRRTLERAGRPLPVAEGVA